jgi:hypothetical protein
MIEKNMSRIYLFFIIALVFSGCRKDKELLTGDIIGKITVYNQDLSISSDMSGVRVNLFSENNIQETTLTDTRGMYHFENISYGKYTIDLQKDRFLKPLGVYKVNHIGGKSPSIFDAYISEIPGYVITVDSVVYQPSFPRLLIYFQTEGNVRIPEYYYIIGYCGDNPSVSKDDYSFIMPGITLDKTSIYADYYQKADAVAGNLSGMFPFKHIYIRFYLVTLGQSEYQPINKDALGKPTNVASFIVP